MKKAFKFLAVLLSVMTFVSSARAVNAVKHNRSKPRKGLVVSKVIDVQPQVMTEASKLYDHLVEMLRLAYTVYRHEGGEEWYSLPEGETQHITREMLEKSYDMSIKRFDAKVCTLREVIKRGVVDGIERPKRETQDQLRALIAYSCVRYMQKELGSYISRDYLISMLSVSNYCFPFREEPDEFDVEYVVIEYFNGELLITCYNGAKITYQSIIGEYYKE